jgi:hypothetical protein
LTLFQEEEMISKIFGNLEISQNKSLLDRATCGCNCDGHSSDYQSGYARGIFEIPPK